MSMLIAILAVGIGGRTFGQGTMGILPDPISTSDVRRDMRPLELSTEQMLAVQRLHDAYGAQFAILRDGDIAAVLADMSALNNTIASREEMEAIFADVDRVLRKISRLDGGFFDEVEVVLSDAQRSEVPRLRLRRERTRYRDSAINFAGTRAPQDVGELVDELELSAESRALIRPTLDMYERSLTKQLRESTEISRQTIFGFFDALEAAGLDRDALEDPEMAGKAMQVIMESQRRLTRDMIERVDDIHTDNRKFVAALTRTLGPRESMALQVAFLTREDRAIGTELAAAAGLWDALQEFGPSNAEEVAATQEALRILDDALDPVVAELMDVTQLRTTFQLMDEDAQNAREKYTTTIQTSSRKLQDAVQAARAQLHDGLVPERMIAINALAAGETAQAASAPPSDPVVSDPTTTAPLDPLDRRGYGRVDAMVSAAISADVLTRYADMVDVSDEIRVDWSESHARYLQQYESLESQMLEGYTAEPAFVMGDNGAYTPNPSYDIDKFHNGRESFTRAVEGLDSTFFEELRAHADIDAEDPLWQRVVDHRTRDRCRSAFDFGITIRNQEAVVELTTLLRHLERRNPTLYAEISPALMSYERTLTPLYRDVQQHSMAFARVNQRWQHRQQELIRNGEAVDYRTAFRDIVGDTPKALHNAVATVGRINAESFDLMLNMLPEDEADRFFEVYHARAFPEIFPQGRSARVALRRALQLNGLSPSVRTELETLASSYMPAWQDCTDQLIELSRTHNMLSAYDIDAQNEWAERERRRERLDYQRLELDAKVITKLDGLLSSEQIASIGGLPAVPEQPEDWWSR